MARSTSQGGGSGALIFLVLCALAAGGIYYYYKTYLEHPPEPPVIAMPTPPPTPSPSPTATPTPAPTETPVETPPPTPTPTVSTPVPLPPLSQLSGRQLPVRVALTRPVTYPLVFNGKPAGQGSAPAGAMVRLVAVRSDTLIEVELEQTSLSLPPEYTDIMDRVRKLMGFAYSTPPPTPVKPVVFSSPTPKRPVRPAVKLSPSSLLSYDFESEVWPGATAGAFGTVDEAGSKQPSTGLKGLPGIASGPLRVHCHEANLGKITLAFNLSANAARPVAVRIESFDDNQIRTGGLESVIYPAAPDFLQRYAVDLSDCKPFGKGTFEPKAAYVNFSFVAGGPAWQGVEKPEVNLDNVHYAVPAYYVSPKGKDSNDGHSEAAPLESPQKAIDLAGPGDIVVLMDGTYDGDTRPVVSFSHTGVPAAWIVLKNYPGQKPMLKTNGWNIVDIPSGEKDHPDTALAYLEVRGLHIRGEGDVAKEKYPEAMNKPDPRTNTNGIAADGRKSRNIPHHLRIADNLVEFCPGCGIGTIDADWVTVENNICRGNCWPTIYAPSGISVMGPRNFDATDNVYKRLVRNNTCNRNETFVEWAKLGRFSDGNGIILDVNVDSDEHPGDHYIGRTLVQSNLCFDNGGSGIHAFRAARVDIINNTAYLNSASKHLEYGQIFGSGADDIRIMNNILVAPVADERAGEKPEMVHHAPGKNDHVTYSNNIYFGGNTTPPLGVGDRVADPQFVKPSRDGKIADFHLKPSSPAVKEGLIHPFGPYADLDGKPRAVPPDAGAYQH